MVEDIEIRRIKDFVKTIIRKRGHKYEDLARALDVSVPTVKRVLNKEAITMQRLLEILKWLGLSLSEVVQLCEESGREAFTQMSEEQEKFVAQNPGHLRILEEITVGKTPKYIQKKYKLNTPSMRRYLLELDRQNLIELYPNDRVRLLIKGTKMRRGGPISQVLTEKFVSIVKENAEIGLLVGNNAPKFSLHFNTNLLIRRKTLEQLHKDIAELDEKYKAIAITEEAVEQTDDLTPVIWFYLVHNTDINDRLFDKPQNFAGTSD